MGELRISPLPSSKAVASSRQEHPQQNGLGNAAHRLPASTSFRRLAATQPVWLCADACLELRPLGTGCEACRDVCPVQAIRVESGGNVLTSSCTGCGQCAAICPSGALLVEGFEALAQTLPEGESPLPLRLECRRVPPSLAADARQVPCLGGIPLTSLIELVACNHTAITLIDRGWCASCPSGAGKSPIDDLTAAARMLAADIGLPAGRLPQIQHMSAPHDLALPASAMPDDTPIARRDFFGALLKKVAGAATAIQSPDVSRLAVKTTRGALSVSPVIHYARKRLAASLIELARQAKMTLSAKYFPDASLSGDCRLHGVCGSVCPSGALAVIRSETSAELRFDAELCLACGLCVRHCPAAALSISHAGNADVHHATGGKIINRRSLHACASCDKAFVAHGDDDICPSCRNRQDMAASLFGGSLAS